MKSEKIIKKKSLGQHFLRSAQYIKRIADAADIQKGEQVLEVGPGEGVLTQEVLSRGAIVWAVEKDRRLIPILQEKFAKEISAKQLVLHEGDILTLSPSDLNLRGAYKVVANIPYYITGAMLKKFLSENNQPASMTLLVQKEVAGRIACLPAGRRAPKESILSLSIKAYATPKYIKTVPRGAFSPPPKVDSAILALYNISKKNFKNKKEEDTFFTLVKAGFAQKRKLLKRNLEAVLGKDAPTLMQSAGMGEGARAEDVPIEQWLKLAAR